MPTPSLRSSEFGLPWNILNFLKLGAHLDYRVSNQTRIERHGLSQGMLCACARIEAHDEVVTIVVGRLQFLRRLWEEKGAPVGDTANDAVLLKNDPASGFGDSRRHILVRSPGYAQTVMLMRRSWVHTLLLQRGGRAVPATVSNVHRDFPIARNTHHSNHLVQHLDGVVDVAVAVSLFPSRKVVAFGKPSRSLPNLQLRRLAPPWRCHIAASPKVHEPAIARHTIHGNIHIMTSRYSVARVVRQLASGATKRPSPFACQHLRQAAQMPRLFTVSAQCTRIMLHITAGRKIRRADFLQ